MDGSGFVNLNNEDLEEFYREVIREMARRNAAGMMELVTSPSRALREDFEFWGDGSDTVPDDLRITDDEGK